MLIAGVRINRVGPGGQVHGIARMGEVWLRVPPALRSEWRGRQPKGWRSRYGVGGIKNLIVSFYCEATGW